MSVSKETKLHTLLAVRKNLEGQSTKVRTDLKKTFSDKQHLFEERILTFQSLEENVDPVTESQSKIQSTVAQEIEWIIPHLAKSLDVTYQVDVANMTAKADVTDDDGNVLLAAVPATTLLQLEKRVAEYKELIAAIPTLDPAKGFELDTARGAGYYRAREVVKPRTRKQKRVLSLTKATDKHPETVQVFDEDVLIGKTTEKEWSARITPADKARLMARVEDVFRAVVAARARANDHAIDISDKKIGTKLLEYIFEPLPASGPKVGG